MDEARPSVSFRIGDLVVHPLSSGTRWVVTLGDSFDAVIGDVFMVVEPQERWRGWFVALRVPEDFAWLHQLSDEERANVDEAAVFQRMKQSEEAPDVAGWGRTVEAAAAHLRAR